MDQATDFLAECAALHALLVRVDEGQLARSTKFKDWTFADIVRHLAIWDTAARLTLQDADAFTAFFAPVPQHMATNSLRAFERSALTLGGQQLVAHWWDNCRVTAELYAGADPKKRLRWGGPDLSARSCITSRLMETWSHAQAIYDELGVERVDGDRIRNVAQIGIQTFGWTFLNRGRQPPGPTPSVALTSPSGDVWRWDSVDGADRITGVAVEFCQVVTQVRNIADTALLVEGPIASEWMSIAQCFAGPPSDPPAPGERFMAKPAG